MTIKTIQQDLFLAADKFKQNRQAEALQIFDKATQNCTEAAHKIYRLLWKKLGMPQEDGIGERTFKDVVSTRSAAKAEAIEEYVSGLNRLKITPAELVQRKALLKKVCEPKLYEHRGAQVGKKETSFRVYAPNAINVSLVLTSFGKEEPPIAMKKQPDGIWEAATNKAPAGKTYLYRIEGCDKKTMLRTDPVSFSTMEVQESRRIESVVVDHSAYKWQDQEWMAERAKSKPLERPLSIYEVHAKSWKSGKDKPQNFRELALDLIAYCKQMGFTHVELYGFQEHRYTGARGYVLSNYFCAYNPMGSCEDVKYLVDQLHRQGIGVIMDWIPAHFQQYHDSSTHSSSLHQFDGSDLYSEGNSPWGSLYFDFNKEEARNLLKASALYWLDIMHIDGLRIDAVSPLIYRNEKYVDSSVSFLKDLNQTIHRDFPGVLTIAEETDGLPMITQPTSKGGLEFDLRWGIPWKSDARNYLKTPYKDRFKKEHHEGKLIHFLQHIQGPEKYVLTHSHDDTDCGPMSGRTLNQSASHAPDERSKFADLRNFFSWQILSPSRGYLIHNGDEIGQTEPWYPRFQRGIPSVDWDLVDKGMNYHRGLQECVKDLNHLYKRHACLWKKGEMSFKMLYHSSSDAVVAYHHQLDKESSRLAVVHNFSDKDFPVYELPLSADDPTTRRIKKVFEIFNSDAQKYLGMGKLENRYVHIIRAGNTSRLRIALPALSTVVLEEILE